MKALVAGIVGLVVGGGVVIGLVAAQDDSPDEKANDKSAEEPVTCPELIPDTAIEGLGWKATAQPSEHAGRCERRVDAGQVTVGERAVGAAGDDRPAALSKEYDAQCAALGEAPQVESSPTWLATEHKTCVSAPENGSGVTTAFVLFDDDIVQIRVVSVDAIGRADLRKGLNQLVTAASESY